MAIITGDFVTRLSGGAGNSSGNASLGGAKSSTVAPTAIDQLFDAVGAAEAVAGDIEYRCVYLHNGNASDSMINAVVFVSANTPNASTTLEIGVGTAAINGTEQTVADETAAPAGVTFSAPSTAGTGLALGTIPLGQHKAIWLRRTVTAGAPSSNNDTWTLGYQCETA
ncbi:MAG: hypothetical protein ACRDAM_03355 [Casimicrobium sp.]